ncbi:MAG: ribonuclease HI family protein [Candidatus Falkowbacteria bacterium]
MKKFIIYTDGGSRGNPGPAGIGAVLYDEDKKVIAEIAEFLGVATNNQAEYKAVIAAFKKAKELGGEELDFYLDSELVVKQLRREYKVKHPDLAPLFLEIYTLSLSFKKITYTHIRREFNKAADKLANIAMDEGMGIV